MNIVLKNKKHFFYMLLFYGGLALYSSVLLAPNQEPFVSNFSMVVSILCFALMIIGTVAIMAYVSISLIITNEKIEFKKWIYVYIKVFEFNFDEIEKVDISYNVFSRCKLLLVFKTGRVRKIDLYWYDSIEGSLDEVKLSQFASADPNLLLGLRIAKTISRQKNLPFTSHYVEE